MLSVLWAAQTQRQGVKKSICPQMSTPQHAGAEAAAAGKRSLQAGSQQQQQPLPLLQAGQKVHLRMTIWRIWLIWSRKVGLVSAAAAAKAAEAEGSDSRQQQRPSGDAKGARSSSSSSLMRQTVLQLLLLLAGCLCQRPRQRRIF
jgi:hypothetical protein